MFIARTAFAGGLLLLLGSGCTIASSSSEVASSDSLVTQETIRLYEGLDVAFGRCDLGTDLVLVPNGDVRIDRNSTVGHASLRESVPQDCESVPADPRTYELVYGGNDCGSDIYVASMTIDGKSRSLKITDHRGRLCKDRVPAPVVVEEESASGTLRLLYARDPKDVTCELGGQRFAPGTTFQDRCNTCSCGADGVMACTAMRCIEPTEVIEAW